MTTSEDGPYFCPEAQIRSYRQWQHQITMDQMAQNPPRFNADERLLLVEEGENESV